MTGYLVIGAVLLLALAVVVYDRWRTACTMKRLDDMLTAAMNGSFSEGTFDESRLSALESRLWRYLTASALSARNVREQTTSEPWQIWMHIIAYSELSTLPGAEHDHAAVS